MVRVPAHTKARQLTINVGAAGFRAIQRFKHEHARAIAEHESVAVCIPRTGRPLWVVVAGGQGTRGSEAANTHWGCCHLGTANKHRIDIACGNHSRTEADVMGACRTGSYHRYVRALQVIENREIPCDHIDDGAWDEKRRYPPGALLVNQHGGIFNGANAANARADGAADSRRVRLGDLKPGVSEGLDTRHHAVLNERVHSSRIARLEVSVNAEVFNAGAKARTKGGRIELLNHRGTAAAIADACPAGINVQT